MIYQSRVRYLTAGGERCFYTCDCGVYGQWRYDGELAEQDRKTHMARCHGVAA